MQSEPVAVADSRDKDKLLQAVRAALRKALGLEHVFVHSEEQARGRLLFQFTTPVSSVDRALLPLRETDQYRFWLEAQLVLLDVGKKYLRSLSLKVLVGEGTESLRPVCRAEWMFPAPDEAEGDTATRHAQPHWHVYDVTAKVVAFDPTPKGFQGYLEAERATERRSLRSMTIAPFDAERVHFSMSSAWHTSQPNASATISSPHAAAAWLRGCVDYIADQLTYAVSKSSQAELDGRP